jgi:hypothetical protein
MASVLIAAFLRRCADELGRFGERSELKVGSFFMPEDDLPSGPELLAEYVAMRPEDVRAALRRIVPLSLHSELQLDDWGWLEKLTTDEGTGVLDVAAAMIRDDIELFHKLGEEASAEHTAAGAKKAGYYFRVEKTIRDRDLLNEFGRQGVLPKYGFPVDVVSMATDHIQLDAANKIELQRDLRMAISEFAPGSQIVAAKTVWTGGGLQKQPNRELVPVKFGVCKHCDRFNHKKEGQDAVPCVGCGRPLVAAPGRAGTFVRPEFGFVAQRMDKSPTPGETRPPRSYTSRVYFDRRSEPPPEGTSTDGATDDATSDDAHWPMYRPVDELSNSMARVERRYSRFGELIVLNHGPERRGFEICRTCGFGRPAVSRSGKGQTDTHKNPRTGRDCSGHLSNLHLGHDFMTDVLEIRISGLAAAPDDIDAEKSRWLSVLYALLEGAGAELEIRRTDLNGTLYYQSGAVVPTLVLYDDVPGGAGHVRRVADELPAVFKAALRRVESCSCGEETACHECLWNYYNQPYHPRLSRGLAAELLRAALGKAF